MTHLGEPVSLFKRNDVDLSVKIGTPVKGLAFLIGKTSEGGINLGSLQGLAVEENLDGKGITGLQKSWIFQRHDLQQISQGLADEVLIPAFVHVENGLGEHNGLLGIGGIGPLQAALLGPSAGAVGPEGRTISETADVASLGKFLLNPVGVVFTHLGGFESSLGSYKLRGIEEMGAILGNRLGIGKVVPISYVCKNRSLFVFLYVQPHIVGTCPGYSHNKREDKGRRKMKRSAFPELLKHDGLLSNSK